MVTITTDVPDLQVSSTSLPVPSAVDAMLHKLYILLTAFMSGLSILGAMVTICTFILVSDLRRRSVHLIVFLSIADGLTACGNLLGVIWVGQHASLGEIYCVFHSALTNYSSASSYLWNICISVYLYMALVHNQQELANRLIPVYHTICWVIPACIVGVALGCGVLGQDVLTHHPSWCWIRSQPDQVMWQLICAKGWEVGAYGFILVFYSLIVCYLRGQKNAILQSMQLTGSKAPRMSAFSQIRKVNRRLMFVPVTFFLLRIWGTIRFLVNTFDYNRTLNTSTMWIAPIQGIGDSGQGFANFVLYCLIPGSVRHLLCQAKCPHLCQCYVGAVTPQQIQLDDSSGKRMRSTTTT